MGRAASKLENNWGTLLLESKEERRGGCRWHPAAQPLFGLSPVVESSCFDWTMSPSASAEWSHGSSQEHQWPSSQVTRDVGRGVGKVKSQLFPGTLLWC